MIRLIVDAPIVLMAVIGDSLDPLVETALEEIAKGDVAAPTIWWAEIRNALVMMERKRRISELDVEQALIVLSALPVSLDATPQSEALTGLMRRYNLSISDAFYLELAARRQSPVATQDPRLARAAAAEGSLWTPAG